MTIPNIATFDHGTNEHPKTKKDVSIRWISPGGGGWDSSIWGRCGCWTKNRGGKTPQSIHFNGVFHEINHPFWIFSPYFWKHACRYPPIIILGGNRVGYFSTKTNLMAPWSFRVILRQTSFHQSLSFFWGVGVGVIASRFLLTRNVWHAFSPAWSL